MTMKICVSCEEARKHFMFRENFDAPDKLTDICKKCTRQHKGRAYGAKYALKYPEKKAAAAIYRTALRVGFIEKEPCSVCGEHESQGHHPSYSKPLEVVWLCRKHHMEEHKRLEENGISTS